MKTEKTAVHFTENYLISPTNPIEVCLVGAGGTGSKVLTALMEMNHSLLALGHAGLQVRLWDDDVITEANLGRQRFAECEIGLKKSVALINRANRWSGTNWKAETVRFGMNLNSRPPQNAEATIYISCVDSVQARFAMADMITNMKVSGFRRTQPKYWLDFGNGKDTGQVILSTIGTIQQPDSQKYVTVGRLPFVTEEFGELLRTSEQTDDTPSCSVAEALEKQDLFINSTLAQMGCSLLWNLFRYGMTEYRGFFLNLHNFRTQPLKVA
ncbi:PRTRC system ThiF family protein [Sphingobacterium multivorum]